MLSKLRISKKITRVVASLVLVTSQSLAYTASLFIVSPSLAGAISSSAVVPTTAVEPNGWSVSTVANVQSSDDTYVSEIGGGSQGYSGFNFSLPAGITALGLEVNAEAYSSTGIACRLGISVSVDAGLSFSDASFFTLSDFDQTYTYGGSTNTLGFTSLSNDDLSATNFVVKIVDNDPGNTPPYDCDNDTEIYVDHLSAIVHYSQEQQVSICHATSSASNPYSLITVAQSSVDGGDDNGDHYANHTGPIAGSLIQAQELKNQQTGWGDIIPPIEGSHDGLNWTEVGQSILQNDCEVPEGEEETIDYCDPSQKPGGVNLAQWLTAQDPVPQCIDYEVDLTVCGEVSVTLTKNNTPYSYGFSYSEGSVDWNYNTNASNILFPEDYNGGSVEVHYWGVGSEKDYFTAVDMPWYEVSSESVTVDTNCEPDVANVIVNKYLVNNNGGSSTSDMASLYINGAPLVQTNTSSPSENITITNHEIIEVESNVEFEITEDYLHGYEQGSMNCFVDSQAVGYPYAPIAGENVVCNVWNYDIPPVVNVYKEARYCDTNQLFNFEITVAEISDSFSLNANCYFDSVSLTDYEINQPTSYVYTTDPETQAGEVTLSELPTDGWLFNGIHCYGNDQYYYSFMPLIKFDVEVGDEIDCYVENERASSVEVTKFHDKNENGEFDEGEETLEGWDIEITGGCESKPAKMMMLIDSENEDEPECDQFMAADTTDSEGAVNFNNLRLGVYKVSEKLQDGWVQSALYCNSVWEEPNNIEINAVANFDEPQTKILEDGEFYLPFASTVNCYIGNHQMPIIDIEKSNNASSPVSPGAEVTFTLEITIPEDGGIVYGDSSEAEYQPVVVVDNLQDEFTYISNSFTAKSNVRGDLKAAGITTDPSYNSPGSWSLTSLTSNQMIPGEVVVLTYKAVVDADTPAGDYPTIATVNGYDVDASEVVSDDDDDTVVVYRPAVLAATSETELASTGLQAWSYVIVGISLILVSLATRSKVAFED